MNEPQPSRSAGVSAGLIPRESWRLDTVRIGRRVLAFGELESTNTTAAELAAIDPDEDGFAVLADHQSAGRGQHGRVWQSPPGCALLMSVVLRPPEALRRPVILTAFAAVAVAESVLELTGIQVRLKWPNDLLIRGKKICGLLIRQDSSAIVLGIGLNLTQTADDFAAASLPDAASLMMVSGKSTAPRSAAEVVLRHLDAEYSRLLQGEQVGVEADWKWRVGLLGRTVIAERTDGSSETGRLHDMSFDGLELEVAAGIYRVVIPETVSQLRAV